MSIRVRRVVVWRTEVENRPGEMARALKALARQDLELVLGYNGAVIDVAPILGRAAAKAARSAGFKPLPTPVILVDGKNRPGVAFDCTRALGEAGISMDSLAAQVAGGRYQALFGFTSAADAKKAADVIRRLGRSRKEA